MKACADRLLFVVLCALLHPTAAQPARVSVNTDERPPATPDDLLREHALNGDLDGVKTALESGAELVHTDPRGHSALQNAAVKGYVDVVEFLLERYVDFARANDGTHEDVVELIDRADQRGRTALWDACRFGHLDVVRALLGAGADPAVQNDEGLDALAIAKSAPQKMQRSDGSQAQMGGHEHIAALLEGVMLAKSAAMGADGFKKKEL